MGGVKNPSIKFQRSKRNNYQLFVAICAVKMKFTYLFILFNVMMAVINGAAVNDNDATVVSDNVRPRFPRKNDPGTRLYGAIHLYKEKPRPAHSKLILHH